MSDRDTSWQASGPAAFHTELTGNIWQVLAVSGMTA
jgi:hypothetical protein